MARKRLQPEEIILKLREVKYLAFPFAADVTCQDESSLFAGKLHAILCREYVKGRDWYDLLFYFNRRVAPNLAFCSGAGTAFDRYLERRSFSFAD